MKTLLLSLITASAMLANGIWDYTGGAFIFCAEGNCPQYTQQDSLDATFVFSEEIPTDGKGTTSVADVLNWSISDSLDHFSFSSADQNATGELEWAKLSQNNGDITHYEVSALTAPCAIQSTCPPGANALGLLGSMDEIVFDYGEPGSWTAVFNAGSWVDPPFAAVAAAPEPGTLSLFIGAFVLGSVITGLVKRYSR